MLITLHNAGRGKIRYRVAHRLPPERNASAREDAGLSCLMALFIGIVGLNNLEIATRRFIVSEKLCPPPSTARRLIGTFINI